MKKLNVQDFAKEELTKKQKTYVNGGHPVNPLPTLPEDGEPKGGSTSSNGTIKDDIIPEPPLVEKLNL